MIHNDKELLQLKKQTAAELERKSLVSTAKNLESNMSPEKLRARTQRKVEDADNILTNELFQDIRGGLTCGDVVDATGEDLEDDKYTMF